MSVQPGDIIGVRSNGWASVAIRLGAALLDKPNMINHIAIMHHTDKAGTPWAIEGRPGGVGWVDARNYLSSSYLIDNVLQPKSDVQREEICATAEHLLGVQYDWVAIGMDAAIALRIDTLWKTKDEQGKVPAHVVCSSAARWVYDQIGLEAPIGDWRTVSPADWAQFCIEHNYSEKE